MAIAELASSAARETWTARCRHCLTVLALSCLGAACAPDTRPNVVLITLDTTRADRIGPMGDASAKTPILDALARNGTVFEHAYTSVPLTLPSHTTMMTGLDPNHHGVHDNGRFVVPPSVETVAERLARRGYDTAAFVAAFVLDSGFGLDQGFSVYDDDIDTDREPLRFTVPRRRGDAVSARALAWLGKPRRSPFFLWAHYYDVHSPRKPPPPFDDAVDEYAGAVTYVDAEVGRLLDGVKRCAAGRATLIIVIGDHGESLGEHDESSHGVVAYDSTLHVPLIVSGPGFPAGARDDRFVHTADVAPTILVAVGEMAPESLDGRPLQGQLANGEQSDRPTYFEAFGPSYGMGWARIAGIRLGRWKFTGEPKPPELYDVLSDPSETANLADREPERVANLQSRYDAVKAPAESAAPSLPPGVRERMAALGYWESAQAFSPGSEPDPRRFVGAMAVVDAARELAVAGKVAQSVEALQILSTSPISAALALRSLGPVYMQAGRYDEAIDAFRRLTLLANGPEARVGLANALNAEGRAAEALEVLGEGVADSSTSSAQLLVTRGEALMQLGLYAQAETLATKALERDAWDDNALALASRARVERDGRDAEIERLQAVVSTAAQPSRLLATRAHLAELLHGAGRDVDAVAVLEAVPDPPVVHRELLAEIAAARGNYPKAVSLYESIVAERSASQAYRHRLAELYEEVGRTEDALFAYDLMIGANPRDASVYVDRGTIREKMGRAREAEDDYRHAITIDPKLAEAHLNVALLELATGREADAERDLLRAVELRPNYAKAHFHLARLYKERGLPSAKVHADQAVQASGRLNPD